MMAGETRSEEYNTNPVLTKTGDERIFAFHNSVVTNTANEIIGTLSSGQDITESLQSEKKLLESEANFRILANYTHDWEYLMGIDNQYVYLSPACEKITGYTANEFINDPNLLLRIIPEEYRERINQHFQEENNKDTPVQQLEFPIINRDGTTRWLEHNCSPIIDEQGHYLGRRGNNHDMTQRKQTENELRLSEEHYRNVVQDQTDSIMRYLPDGTITFVNHSFCRAFNTTPEQEIGKNLLWQATDTKLRRINQKISKLNLENQTVSDEHQSTSETGAKVWHLWVDRGLFDENGALKEIQAVGRDITSRKQAETEREQALQEA